MNYDKAADKIIDFIRTELTQKLADIYKETGVHPADSFNLFVEQLNNCESYDIVNEANILSQGD